MRIKNICPYWFVVFVVLGCSEKSQLRERDCIVDCHGSSAPEPTVPPEDQSELIFAQDLLEISIELDDDNWDTCLLYTSPSPRDATLSRMPSSA